MTVELQGVSHRFSILEGNRCVWFLDTGAFVHCP